MEGERERERESKEGGHETRNMGGLETASKQTLPRSLKMKDSSATTLIFIHETCFKLLTCKTVR